MKVVLQRVSHASIEVDNQVVGSIGHGILALVGFDKADTIAILPKALERIINYRIFADENNKMNLSLVDISGGLLLVPQFTLAASTQKGLRPSFSTSLTPEPATELFNELVSIAQSKHRLTETGVFGADMKVSLLNDGPVTFIFDL